MPYANLVESGYASLQDYNFFLTGLSSERITLFFKLKHNNSNIIEAIWEEAIGSIKTHKANNKRIGPFNTLHSHVHLRLAGVRIICAL